MLEFILLLFWFLVLGLQIGLFFQNFKLIKQNKKILEGVKK